MEYINLHVSVLDSDAFKGATPTQRSTWLCLTRYLVGQEDGDTIEKCRGWVDRKWQQVCAVTLSEVDEVCELWKWDGDDLVVNFYPEQAEKQVRAMRKGGVIGNKRRWGKKRTTDTPPESPPESPRERIGDSPGVSIMKWNEMKRNETPPAPEEEKQKFSESVSDDLVFAFAADWPGEPATGAPKIPMEFVTQYLARINGRREWPKDWKRHLVSEWRATFRKWQAGAEKKCVDVSNKGTGETAAQRRYRLDKQREGLQAQWDALDSIGGDTSAVDAELSAVEREIKELEA